jgi:hypothetical protein
MDGVTGNVFLDRRVDMQVSPFLLLRVMMPKPFVKKLTKRMDLVRYRWCRTRVTKVGGMQRVVPHFDILHYLHAVVLVVFLVVFEILLRLSEAATANGNPLA